MSSKDLIRPSEKRKPAVNSKSFPGVRIVTATWQLSRPADIRICRGSSAANRSLSLLIESRCTRITAVGAVLRVYPIEGSIAPYTLCALVGDDFGLTMVSLRHQSYTGNHVPVPISRCALARNCRNPVFSRISHFPSWSRNVTREVGR